MIDHCIKTRLAKCFFCLFFLPLLIPAFEPKPVTPYPVLGYREVPFFDNFHNKDRNYLVWYPVAPSIEGEPSNNPWDGFAIAKSAPPATPEGKSLFPVIVISHGYTGNPHQLSWLIRGLVQHGFLVIGLEHLDLIEGKAHINHWQRALDIRTLLDHFSVGPFASIANLNQMGIAGFSLGGTTVIWVAGGIANKLDSLIPGPEYASKEDYVRADEALPTLNKERMAQSWKDTRIKAAFAMAPAWSWLFDEESLKKISIPTYLIAAASDKVLVTKNNAGLFAKYIPRSFYQAIAGDANHYIFISALNEKEKKKADPDEKLSFLFEESPLIDRRWIQSQVVEEAARFFNSVFTP